MKGDYNYENYDDHHHYDHDHVHDAKVKNNIRLDC